MPKLDKSPAASVNLPDRDIDTYKRPDGTASVNVVNRHHGANQLTMIPETSEENIRDTARENTLGIDPALR